MKNVPRNLRRWNLHTLPLISHQAATGISFLLKTNTFLSRKPIFLILLEIKNLSFATRILSLPPWPAPPLVATILFLPDSVEFFKRCASPHTCAVHEIYPLTDDFNVSDSTCVKSSLLLRRFVFRMAEASAKRVTGNEPQGAMGRIQTEGFARCLLPAFLCAHISSKERRLGTRQRQVCV